MRATTEHDTEPDRPISKNHYRLGATARRKITDRVEAREFTCRSCDSRRFEVGDALEMGSVWPDEELGACMIALTCRGCGTPTGIRLQESEFLPPLEASEGGVLEENGTTVATRDALGV